jgi:hypothetical protein
MPAAGLEPAIPAAKRPQTYALDRATTGISKYLTQLLLNDRLALGLISVVIRIYPMRRVQLFDLKLSLRSTVVHSDNSYAKDVINLLKPEVHLSSHLK